jgi:hypothetical protein
MTYSGGQSERRFVGGSERILNRDFFLQLLDLEVRRARRYQNFFCILVMRLNQLLNPDNGAHRNSCYEKLTRLLKDELRESDILGSLNDDCIVAILPYGDAGAGDHARTRFEGSLKYYDFKSDGYEVLINQFTFPIDGADTSELVKKVSSIAEA